MRHVILVVLMLLVCPVTTAAEESIYESLSGVKIGRVFLYQYQRDTLDARRLAGPPVRSHGQETPHGTDETSREAASAGYIIGPNGRSRIWANGDFVEAGGSRTRSMAFPGDVKVTRHVVDRQPVDADDPDTTLRANEAESNDD